MRNVSRMPIIRTGSHRIMRVELDLGTLAKFKPTILGS